MSFCPFIPIVGWLIYSVIRYGTDSFQPSPEWKPAGKPYHSKNSIEPTSANGNIIVYSLFTNSFVKKIQLIKAKKVPIYKYFVIISYSSLLSIVYES